MLAGAGAATPWARRARRQWRRPRTPAFLPNRDFSARRGPCSLVLILHGIEDVDPVVQQVGDVRRRRRRRCDTRSSPRSASGCTATSCLCRGLTIAAVEVAGRNSGPFWPGQVVADHDHVDQVAHLVEERDARPDRAQNFSVSSSWALRGLGSVRRSMADCSRPRGYPADPRLETTPEMPLTTA